MAKTCQECQYKDTCDHKRLEALAYIDENIAAPLMQDITTPMRANMAVKHDYRDVKIDTNTTITIDLEEMHEQLQKEICRGLYIGIMGV